MYKKLIILMMIVGGVLGITFMFFFIKLLIALINYLN